MVEAPSKTSFSAQHLVKKYGARTVVNDVSLSVEQGEIVGLLGKNGAGKTTTFYMMVGLIPVGGGSVMLGKHTVTKEPMYRRAQLGVGYLPQEASVFRKLTVRDNLSGVAETLRLSRKERKERVDQLLEEFGLQTVAKQQGITLSGGERRRLEIARALVSEPQFLLLDEPFSGVDPINVQEVKQIILQLKEKNIGILITDHNAHEILSVVDRVYLMYEGKILIEGTRDELINDEQARELYLGKDFNL